MQVHVSMLSLLTPKQAVIFFHLFGNGTHTGSIGKNLVVLEMEPIDLYENTGWKCQAPTPRTIKIIVSNLNWE